eukprot:TRINITY_DN7094_c0_g3_i1.p1 TRINITY_DN7094_c0_g3~~TRINITY_DN7094_c0_g3_i1.p1  ORF type:complete len:386 (+),score=43.51 TRINITY_DN7094_c0_g3_i1:92-1249(+)
MSYARRSSPSRSPSRAVDDIAAVDYFAAFKSPQSSPLASPEISDSRTRGTPPPAPRTPPPHRISPLASPQTPPPVPQDSFSHQSSPQTPQSSDSKPRSTPPPAPTPPPQPSSPVSSPQNSPQPPPQNSFSPSASPDPPMRSPSRSPSALASEDLALSSLSMSSRSQSTRSKSKSGSASPPHRYTAYPAGVSKDRFAVVPAVSAQTAEGERMIGQLGGIHCEMQELVTDIRRLTEENEWLKSQLQEAESSNAEWASEQQSKRNQSLNQIRMLERDLVDAKQQRSVVQCELNDLEAQLDAEMQKTRRLRQSNGILKDTYSNALNSSPPPMPHHEVVPVVMPMPVPVPVVRQVPSLNLAPAPRESPKYPLRALSPRQRFGAPSDLRPS